MRKNEESFGRILNEPVTTSQYLVRKALTPHGLYTLSLTFFLACLCGLTSVIFIDVLPQSFSTGQFWNAIIAITALCITAITACVLFFARIAHNRIWFHKIPRDYTISRRDAPARIMDVIENCCRYCRERFENQFEGLDIEHPGLQNPKKGEMVLETPYSMIAEALPRFMEEQIVTFYVRFTRKRGTSLRQYLFNAMAYQIFPSSAEPFIEAFLQHYEKIRFGKDLASEQEFYDLFSAALACMHQLIIPESSREVTDNASIKSADSDQGSVIIRDKSVGQLLHTLSHQQSYSTVLRNSSSELSLPHISQNYTQSSGPLSQTSLPEIVRRYTNDSSHKSDRFGRRRSQSTTYSSKSGKSFLDTLNIPPITITRYRSNDTANSRSTVLHHNT